MSLASAFARLDAAQDFVIAQLGQSLDGRIATHTGESRGINGRKALDHLHRLRARVDAVVVGVGTVLADDPRLTVRRGIDGAQPARVVIDPAGRAPRRSGCLNCDDAPRFVIVAGGSQTFAPWPEGVEIIRLDAIGGHFRPAQIIAALAARGLRRILVEGGAHTISKFIDHGCVDQLHLLVSPLIIGAGRAGLELAAPASLDQALRPETTMHDLGGGDVLFDCNFPRRSA